ncbi:MAG TPA: phosphoribosylamine--glycine ligase [Gemmatimonadaceae bacterium]|nr:phosphoribosylamine--glycine ligase [Gemmatimonadaceae bacterium]
MRKTLIVGGGGREHAIAWKLAQDDSELELIAAPGNPGIAAYARCVAVSASDIAAIAQLADDEQPGLTIIGPEAPLAAGLADELQKRGHLGFGPTAAAARIESSKAFAKELMREAGVPTAAARVFTEPEEARTYARELGAPVVVKASGLAAGKGVTVCGTLREADQVIDALLRRRALGDSGSQILVEEFMQGEELSVLVITDGERFTPLLPARDHKRLGEGDTGPNTGGMGAYAPVPGVSLEIVQQIGESIIQPTLAALREHGSPFRGVLYAGLMLTPDGPRVVEFNCRFGDPETQVILPLLESPLLPLLASAARGALIEEELVWNPAYAVTTVIAAAGYPLKPRTGDRITLPPSDPDVIVFHAGTATDASGTLVSSGGRVLAITGMAPTFERAVERSRNAAEAVQLEGKHMRRDIGGRELARRA